MTSIALVGAREQRRGYRDAKRLGGLHVDDQFDFRLLQDRQVGGFFTLEDSPRIDANLTIGVIDIGSVAHEPANFDVVARAETGWQPIPRRQNGKLNFPGVEENVRRDKQRIGPVTAKTDKGLVNLLASGCVNHLDLQPEPTRRLCTFSASEPADGSVGLLSTATLTAVGSNSRSNAKRFCTSTSKKIFMPVALPPGRLRLATRPSLTGSSGILNTIGILVVAEIAARAAGIFPGAAITATPWRTRSSASSGNRSYWPSAQRYSIETFWPSVNPVSPSPRRKALSRSGRSFEVVAPRYPITGVVGCCARATTGHATDEPAIALIKSRRRIAFPKAQDHANVADYNRNLRPAKWGSGG